MGLTTDEEKEQAAKATEENSGLFDAMRDALDGDVEKVVVSTRLTDAPVVLTTEGTVSLQMAQMFKHQPGGAEDAPEAHVVLEVNDKHPIFDVMKKANEAGDSEKVADYTKILYNQALLVEGLPIEDPLRFAEQISRLMV